MTLPLGGMIRRMLQKIEVTLQCNRSGVGDPKNDIFTLT
jgi:hypothetical protein